MASCIFFSVSSGVLPVDTSRQIRRIGRVTCFRFLNNYQIFQDFRPACFNILFHCSGSEDHLSSSQAPPRPRDLATHAAVTMASPHRVPFHAIAHRATQTSTFPSHIASPPQFASSTLTPHTTGSKKHSDEERGLTLFTLRVNAIVMFIFGLASLLTLTPQVNRQYQEKGKPLQSTMPHSQNPL